MMPLSNLIGAWVALIVVAVVTAQSAWDHAAGLLVVAAMLPLTAVTRRGRRRAAAPVAARSRRARPPRG